jgi:hypothetical protein
MEDKRYYRIVSRQVFERIPFDGIVGNRESQRSNNDGNFFLVERAKGFPTNDRWLDVDEILSIVSAYDWWKDLE